MLNLTELEAQIDAALFAETMESLSDWLLEKRAEITYYKEMDNKIKVVNKGYTITVVSWEGTMNNSQTNSITVKTKEVAEIWYNMMALCKSKNNQPPGVIKLGDTVDWFDEEQTKLAADFIKEYVIKIAPEFNTAEYLPTPMWDDDDCVETFVDLASELLGSSEFYCRVCGSCTISYSPKNIYVEEIKFEKNETIDQLLIRKRNEL